MKKVLSIFLIQLLVSLFCISCGDDSSEDFANTGNLSDTDPADTDSDTNSDSEPTDTDPSDTVSDPECGNKITEEGEVCDGGAKECSGIDPSLTGYATCKADCSGWDESGCITETPDASDEDPSETDDSDPAATDTTVEKEICKVVSDEIVCDKDDDGDAEKYDCNPVSKDDAMKGNDKVKVEKVKEDAYFFDGPGTDEALIFYQGAQVEEESYSPILLALAEKGVDCFLISKDTALIGDLPVAWTDNPAETIVKNYSYEKYYFSGHSMGGAMIADRYVAKNMDKVSGLFLLAAYPTENLTSAKFPILFIYGSEDGVINQENLQAGIALTPATTTSVVLIEGGNHAYFGDYGEQNKDGTATITREQQERIAVRKILKLIR